MDRATFEQVIAAAELARAEQEAAYWAGKSQRRQQLARDVAEFDGKAPKRISWLPYIPLILDLVGKGWSYARIADLISSQMGFTVSDHQVRDAVANARSQAKKNGIAL